MEFVLNLTGSFAQIATVEHSRFSSLPTPSLWDKPKYVNTGSMNTVSVWVGWKNLILIGLAENTFFPRILM